MIRHAVRIIIYGAHVEALNILFPSNILNIHYAK